MKRDHDKTHKARKNDTTTENAGWRIQTGTCTHTHMINVDNSLL